VEAAFICWSVIVKRRYFVKLRLCNHGNHLLPRRRTEHYLEALRRSFQARVPLVIREGEEHAIAGRDVVRGDIVILHEGDRVPADGILLSRSTSVRR